MISNAQSPSMATMFSTVLSVLAVLPLCAIAAASDGVASEGSDRLSPYDSLAGDLSPQGGTLIPYHDDGGYVLTLQGVTDEMMVVEDPTDASTSRSVNQVALTGSKTFPRFAVLVVNNSNTAASFMHPAKMTFMSMELLGLAATAGSRDGVHTRSYLVNMLNHDINNATGTAGLVDPRFLGPKTFPHAMLMIDLTTNDGSEKAKNPRSLRQLVDNDGLTMGLVPVPMSANSTEVQAQGVWTTAFLGPFNAWAWACCAYKLVEHWIAIAFPLSWLTLFLCCV